MKKITAKEFLAMIKKNPSVFEYWDTPLEITQYVNCEDSLITHLSPHLIFSGKNAKRTCANFSKCKSLKTATGTFHGFTSFEFSGIEKIKYLHIQSLRKEAVASFAYCKNLQIATGNYAGFVNFQHTGIHSIQNLNIKLIDETDIYADFLHCENLKTLESWDITKVFNIEPHKLEAEKKRRKALQKILKEMQPKELPFL
jgi:hypothetical protein